ncbi:MAG: hypothetical protein IJ825_00905 [Oscillospiraceae bacterium]|nr:hypothetical protein [Oscillospiraceae bacterium]
MMTILAQPDLTAYRERIAALELPVWMPVMASEAKDGDAVRGSILYSYEPELVTIFDVADQGDLACLDGLVRSVLFKAQLRGIGRAVFRVNDPAMRSRLEMLRFVKNDENILENIAEIMDSCKSCRKNPETT